MLERRLPLIESVKLIEDFEKLLDSLAMAKYKKGLDLALRKKPGPGLILKCSSRAAR